MWEPPTGGGSQRKEETEGQKAYLVSSNHGRRGKVELAA